MTSWTTPPTFTAAQVITHTNLNSYLRDDLKYLKENLDWGYGFPVCTEPSHHRGGVGLQAANRCLYQRMRGFGSITNLAVHVIVSIGNIGLALYVNSGLGETAVPGTRAGTSGSIACPAAGYASTAVVAADITAGSHWAALSASSASATFSGQNTSGVAAIAKGGAVLEESGHPPPTTPGLRADTQPYINVVGL